MFTKIVCRNGWLGGSGARFRIRSRGRSRGRRGPRLRPCRGVHDRQRRRPDPRRGRGLRVHAAQQGQGAGDEGVATHVEVTTVRVGGPAPAIREIADRLGADLIVVGTRGHTPLAGVVLGSVAQRLLTIAEQPVLVVPEGAKPPAGATEMPATEGATA